MTRLYDIDATVRIIATEVEAPDDLDVETAKARIASDLTRLLRREVEEGSSIIAVVTVREVTAPGASGA